MKYYTYYATTKKVWVKSTCNNLGGCQNKKKIVFINMYRCSYDFMNIKKTVEGSIHIDCLGGKGGSPGWGPTWRVSAFSEYTSIIVWLIPIGHFVTYNNPIKFYKSHLKKIVDHNKSLISAWIIYINPSNSNQTCMTARPFQRSFSSRTLF